MTPEQLDRIPALTNHKSTLKEMSKDDKEYMVEFENFGINFDEVVKDYTEFYKLSQTPSSNDGFVWEKSGRIYFVEFKNGNLQKSSEKHKIKTKIYDSILILMDIADISLESMRETVEYILVYNEEKGRSFLENEEKNASSNSQSLHNLANSIYKTKKNQGQQKELILFGLEKFQNYCFKAVHTYTVPQFEEYLKKGT